MTIRSHVVVSGIVQGVFYRDFTQRRARALGLSGWVRNLPDGRVEAVAQGEKESITRLVQAMRQGPPSARVDRLEFSWQAPEADLPDFEIRF